EKNKPILPPKADSQPVKAADDGATPVERHCRQQIFSQPPQVVFKFLSEQHDIITKHPEYRTYRKEALRMYGKPDPAKTSTMV
ncbi:hypothetical protein PENTCL1PPCAC_9708, partial [Pristionchus entomophagus]